MPACPTCGKKVRIDNIGVLLDTEPQRCSVTVPVNVDGREISRQEIRAVYVVHECRKGVRDVAKK